MDYNFHAHTKLCSHAAGTEEEYVLQALEAGITCMGFADHMPLRYENGHESTFRVPVDSAAQYIRTILELKERYRDRMEIHVGFEMEYFPGRFERMVNFAAEVGAEYLILGQHFLEEEYPDFRHAIKPSDSIDDLKQYASLLCDAMQTGRFTYIAHPDMIHFTGAVSEFQKAARTICEASRETKTPLEINFLGIRDQRNYPNPAFWAVAGEVGCPVTFGLDAHDPAGAADRASLPKAQKLVAEYGLRYIGRPELVSIRP